MFKNMTPHTVNLLINGERIAIEPTGIVPRVSTEEIEEQIVEGITTVKVVYKEIYDLPEQQEGVYIITSKICCDAAPDRSDLFYPTRLVRDESGRIVGCDALAQ